MNYQSFFDNSLLYRLSITRISPKCKEDVSKCMCQNNMGSRDILKLGGGEEAGLQSLSGTGECLNGEGAY